MANQKKTDTEVTEVVTTEVETTEENLPVEEVVEPIEEVTEEEVVEPNSTTEVNTEEVTEEVTEETETHSLVEEVTKPKAKRKKSENGAVSVDLLKEDFINESNLEVSKYVGEYTTKQGDVEEYNVMTITKTTGGNYVEIVLVHEGVDGLIRFTSKDVVDQINKVINKLGATMDESYTVSFNGMSIGGRTISFLAF